MYCSRVGGKLEDISILQLPVNISVTGFSKADGVQTGGNASRELDPCSMAFEDTSFQNRDDNCFRIV